MSGDATHAGGTAPSRPTDAVRDLFGLTPMQQGMLFHALSAPDAPLYLQQMVLEISGVGDAATLRAGFADLVARHPTLRTAVLADAPRRPLQAVLATAELPIAVDDLRGRPIGLADRRTDEILAEHRARPFDLRRPPLLRAHAVRVADDRWLVATTHHHLVIDGWSVPLLHADLTELLQARRDGRSARLAPVPGFVEFVRWLADRPQPDPDAHYRRLLGDLTAPTGLGVDRAGRLSATDTDIDWDQVVLTRDNDRDAGLDRQCRARGLLPATLVQAAWGLLLARYADADDAVFAMTVSGRPAELPDAATRVGMFVNSVPVRVQVGGGQRVGEWLAEVHAQLAAAREFEQVPVGQAQRCSGIPLSRPLFESVVAFQNYWRPSQDRITADDPSGVTVAVRDRRERTSLPVAVAVALPPRHVWVRLDYDRRRFDRPVAERMAADYARLLSTLAGVDPDTPLDEVTVTDPVPVPPAPAGPDRSAGLLAEALSLSADDRVLAALAPDDPLLPPLASAVSAAGATLDVRDPLLPGACAATVLVGPPGALSRMDTVPGRVMVTDGPPQPALLRDLLAAGSTVHRLVGAPGVGVLAAVPVPDPDSGLGLGQVPGGRLVDRAGRATPLGAAGRLLVADVDTGIRARIGASGAFEQLAGPSAPAPAADPDWVADVLARHPRVRAAAVLPGAAGSIGWLVPADGEPDPDEVLDAARRVVPAELLPTEMRVVPWLPHTATGAVHLAALAAADPAPDGDAAAGYQTADGDSADGRAASDAPDGPLTRRFRALPADARRGLLDRLRAARATAGRPRRHRGGPVPDSFAQRAWRRLPGVPLRADNVLAAGTVDCPDGRIRTESTPDGTVWRVAPDVLDVMALAALAEPATPVSDAAPGADPTDPTGDAPDDALSHDDYAAWQADPRRAAAREADLAFWRRELAGAPASGWLTDLGSVSTTNASPAGPSPAGATVGETHRCVAGPPIEPEHWLAAAAVAAAALGRDDEQVLGVLTRPALPDGIGTAPGPYTRMLPVRVPTDTTAGLAATVHAVRARLAAARAHAEVPAEELTALLAETPLLSIAVHEAPGRLSAHPDTTIGVDVAPDGDGYRLTAVFDAVRMRAETASALLRRVAALARWAVHTPDRPVAAADLVDGEEAALLARWADGGTVDDAPATLPQLVARQVVARGEHTAVEGPDGLLSYAALWRRAGALAARLRAEGVGVDDRVAVCLPRGTTMVWSALGVLLSGAGYLPVDPAYPADRVRFMCADAGVRVAVTADEWRDRFDTAVVCPDTESLSSPAPSSPAPSSPAVAGGPARPAGSGDTANLPDTGAARPDGTAYVIYTSGSTGTPKGVVVEHRAVADFCRHIATAYHIDAHTRLLGFAALTFDVSVFDLWAALTTGATLVLADDEERLSVDRLQKLLVERRVTAAELPPSLLPLLDPSALGDLRLVSVGGEAPAGALVDAWATADREFWNGYGPTETTVAVTLMRCDPPSQGRIPPIGRPMPNHRAYVLDEALRPVGVGVPGELCVGGAGLARGYLNRPGLTADRFVPDPFAGPGQRLYRTGDLVRWTPDGILEFLGRVDRQVKLRGFRIELGEVEAVLAADDRVRQVAVEPWTDEGGTKHLTAYLVAADGAGLTLADVRGIAADRLPDYMVPTRSAVLDRLPLTATGKLDRSALPAPPAPETAAGGTDTAEWTDEERVVAEEIFAPLLGLPAVGLTDDFFALGGNSLQATQVTARVRDRFAAEVSLADLFADPTVAQVARLIARARQRAGRQRARLDSSADTPRMVTGAVLPASYPQEWLWQAEQRDGGNSRFNAPFRLRLGGELNLDALRRAFELILERHATLRITLREEDGRLVQQVHPTGRLELTVVDVPGDDPDARRSAAAELVTADADRVFDLRHGPMLRVSVFRLADTDHIVQWVVHHVATDGWSTGLLLWEIGQVYQAMCEDRPDPLPPLNADYGEFVQWHRDYVDSDTYREDLGWWSTYLDGARGPRLITDRPRESHTFAPGYLNLSLPDEVSTGMAGLTRDTRSTMFMVTLTAYAIVLAAAGDVDELTVLTPNALRVRQSWEDLVGWFANRVVLRIRLRPDATFAEQLATVRRDTMAAFAHQYMPFELVRNELALPDETLTACFSVQNAPVRGVTFRGFGLGMVDDPSGRDFTPIGEVYAPLGVKYECSVVLRDRGDRIAGGLEYDAGLFDADRATGWRDGFLRILSAATADPTTPVSALRRLTVG